MKILSAIFIFLLSLNIHAENNKPAVIISHRNLAKMIPKKDLENLQASIKKTCGLSPLSKWRPIAFFASGWQSAIYQVCDTEQCNFLLKTASPEEASFSEQMGLAKIGPPHLETIACDEVAEKRAIVMKKLNGNLGDLLFPPKALDKIFPQVLNLIYRSITEQGVCHRDTKITNFFYELFPDGSPKIYLGDFGLALRCDELRDPSRGNYSHLRLKSTLREYLNTFIKSFFKPQEFGIETEIDPLSNADIAKNFLTQLNMAIQKDEKWKKHFNGVEGFNFGYLISD